jgi:hypothetical protein
LIHLVTEEFCDAIISIAETHGKWSHGSLYDNRLSNGFEPHPTIDILLQDVGLYSHYLHFLKTFILPIQKIKMGNGYFMPEVGKLIFLNK